MKTFTVEISTPQKTFSPRTVGFLDVPAEHGRLTVLAGHQPMVCVLLPGLVRTRSGDGEEDTLVIGSGTMTVAGGDVSILADSVTTGSPPR